MQCQIQIKFLMGKGFQWWDALNSMELKNGIVLYTTL